MIARVRKVKYVLAVGTCLAIEKFLFICLILFEGSPPLNPLSSESNHPSLPPENVATLKTTGWASLTFITVISFEESVKRVEVIKNHNGHIRSEQALLI